MKTITAIVLCYNNFDLIYRTIDSILEQDYPAIELIISDDGSKIFDEAALSTYIERHKRENIKSVLLLRSEQNQGTVRNIRRALACYTGDYYINLGADDRLAHPQVFRRYMDAFVRQPDALLVCANAAMYSRDMSKFLWNMMTPEDIRLAQSRDAARIFSTLSYKCMLMTVATCYSRKYTETIGLPDLHYKYSEEYPAFLKMTRRGIAPAFIDEVLTHHAIGGLANGSANYSPAVLRGFFADKTRMWRREVKPYWQRIALEDRQRHLLRLKNERRSCILQCSFAPKGKLGKYLMVLRHPGIPFWRWEQRRGRATQPWDRISRLWPRLWKLSGVFLVGALAFFVGPVFHPGIDQVIFHIFISLFALAFLGGCVCIILRIYKKARLLLG